MMEPRTDLMLQVNTSGAWRNVLTFKPSQRAAIIEGFAGLAGILDENVTWCIHHPNGKREWLHAEDFQASAWRATTPEEPEPLVDVMVSAYDACDRVGVVFMAWRNKHGIWLISGSDEPMSLPVYAYRPVVGPAPVPPMPTEPAAGPHITCGACGAVTDNILSPLCNTCAATALLDNYKTGTNP